MSEPFEYRYQVEHVEPSVREELVWEACRAITAQHDNVLRATIEDYCGGEVTAAELNGRCLSTIYPGGRQVYCVDNIPLVEFYPTETEVVGNRVFLSRKYRVLFNKNQKELSHDHE